MNQENRQKVLNYCAMYDTYPLYFNGYESNKEEFDPSKYTVEDMIRRVLVLAKSYGSYNANTDEYESSKDRWRSSLDIWRHIVYYYPTIEIFDVMHELYRLYKTPHGLVGQFCNDICRRTFKLSLGESVSDYMSRNMLKVHNNNREFDEYELDWEDWKDI